ncbi:putative transporter [Tuber magnatum]|uniref:Putative transporter n=1 Tax=Tuber magnatum TaxID=42249 RepID=A0A317T1T8_9PEZI|nr:putative transporter [Tuber magnatum]
MGFLIKKPENEAGKALPAIVIGVFVSFGGILFGYDTGTINGILAMDYFQNEFATGVDSDGKPALTAGQTSLIVSILSAGTFCGALTASPFGDILGRRMGLIASCLIFSIGVAFQVASTTIPLMAAGRVVAGFGVGLVSALVPLYQSESAPKWIRGTIVGCYQLAITIGLLLAACANQGTHARKDHSSYRIPLAIQFIWAAILAGGMLLLPETPRYFVKKDDMQAAAKSMSRLRSLPADHPALVEELNEIKAIHDYEMSLGVGNASYADCFKSDMIKRLMTGCGLQALQQLTGINFIFYYGTQFFKNTGIENAFLIGLITNLVNVISTFPGLWMVEKMGRRNLLLFGAVGMCLCQFIVAIVGLTTSDHADAANKVLIAFVCFYIFFFACSWGPCTWVVTGEIYPLKVRAKCLSISTATNWLLNWAIGYSTPYLTDKGSANLGLNIFFLWGGCCFIATAFVYFFIYETKGLSLEDVDQLYMTVDKAWRSQGFIPSISYSHEKMHATGHGPDGKPSGLSHSEGGHGDV